MTRIKAWLAALALALGGVWRIWRRGKAQGRVQARTEGLEDAAKRTEAGRAAVQRGRDSGGTPDERLRRNDGAWR